MVAAGAAVVGVPSLLTGCGTDGRPRAPARRPVGATSCRRTSPSTYVEPDFPSVNGSTPGYTTLPAELVQSVPTRPGSGPTFTAMTPLWGTIPPTSGNQYYDAVNAMLGSTIEFQITDGNIYGDKLATVLASAKDVPGLGLRARPGTSRRGSAPRSSATCSRTSRPYLAGDKVKDVPEPGQHPHRRLEVLRVQRQALRPAVPGEIITDATFYRKRRARRAGHHARRANGHDLLDLATELTGGDRWGAEDLWNTSASSTRCRRGGEARRGPLVHRVETAEYRAALAWNAELFASGAVHPDAVADQQR